MLSPCSLEIHPWFFTVWTGLCQINHICRHILVEIKLCELFETTFPAFWITSVTHMHRSGIK